MLGPWKDLDSWGDSWWLMSQQVSSFMNNEYFDSLLAYMPVMDATLKAEWEALNTEGEENV